MNTITKQLFTLSAALVGGLSHAHADPFAFTDGDLILGVQATGGTGTGKNVFFNLGPGTALRDNPNQGLKGNINATLTSAYGASWYTRTDLWFGVIGNLRGNANTGFGSAPAVNNDPSRTFYVSTPADSAGQGLLYPAATFPGGSLSQASTFLSGMEGIFPALTAEADGSAILDQTTLSTEWNNGWTYWNPTPGSAFGNFAALGASTAGIQNNFGKGTPSTYVDVQRILSTNTGAVPTGVIGGGTYEGTVAISSTGAITILSSSPASAFTTWIDGYTVQIPNAADRLPGADPDQDDIENVLEFVLDGNPSVSSQTILPTLDASGTDFVFSFNRRDDSESPETTQTFQYGTDLVNWTDVTIGAASAGVVTVNENGVAVDGIIVTIPKGTNTKLFGRFKVVKP